MDEVMDEAEYVDQRVDPALSYYEGAANKAKRRHMRIQTSTIVLGVLIPVAVNLPDEMRGIEVSAGLQIGVTLMSLALAILNGLANLRNFGELWLSFRLTEESLKKEKFLYLARSGRYADVENAYGLFVENFESMIYIEHERFHCLHDEARRPTGPSGSTGSTGSTASTGSGAEAKGEA
jgi:hypothetical protein